MRDTLKVDDRILVQKVSYWFGDVQRGDIVVFDDPADWLGEEEGQEPSNVITKAMSAIGLYPTGGHLVKRVIGIGGDHVACKKRHRVRQRRQARRRGLRHASGRSPAAASGKSMSPRTTSG